MKVEKLDSKVTIMSQPWGVRQEAPTCLIKFTTDATCKPDAGDASEIKTDLANIERVILKYFTDTVVKVKQNYFIP